jgi:predicted kinase
MSRAATTTDWRATFQSLWLPGPVDWPAIEARLPFVLDLRACMQDPVFHAEGDVWTHTRMVVEALKADPQFACLPEDRRCILALAALLHDIAKPETRAEQFDPALGRMRVTHNHHSSRGAQRAWVYLWETGVPAAIRADIHALILWHQKSFHTFASPKAETAIRTFSLIGSWHELLLHTQADNRGRLCPTIAETAEALDLLRLQIEELGCLHQPWPFATDASRLYWLDDPAQHSPFFTTHPEAGSHVILMSGIPGMGKDTYIRRHLSGWPVVSLDQLRLEMGVSPEDNQGTIIQAAMEATRVHLRAKRRFVWNATNLTRLHRSKIVSLCRDYGATVEIHALDTPAILTRQQNRDREKRVPDSVIADMLNKWEPPTPLEAHKVVWVRRDDNGER